MHEISDQLQKPAGGGAQSKTVVRCKIKHLQNIFANVLGCWIHIEDRRWLHVKQNILRPQEVDGCKTFTVANVLFYM